MIAAKCRTGLRAVTVETRRHVVREDEHEKAVGGGLDRSSIKHPRNLRTRVAVVENRAGSKNISIGSAHVSAGASAVAGIHEWLQIAVFNNRLAKGLQEALIAPIGTHVDVRNLWLRDLATAAISKPR